MEELLNKLIERGRRPFGNKKIKDAKTARWNKNLLDEEENKVSKFKDKVAFTNGVLIFDEINLRELVSKESGLWQFVCENGMIKSNGYCNGWAYHNSYDEYDEGDGMYDEGGLPRYYDTDYQYRVIESALKDESELEQFLLNNITVGN